MAVAGMNNLTVLESSYLGENYPPVSRRRSNQERPITRTSFIRKMWRDLEGENRFREIEKQQQTSGNTESQCSCSSVGAESEEDASITTSEVENECPRNQNQMDLQNRQEDNVNSIVQRSPALCLADKQRVRQIFREWGNKNSNHGHTSYKNHNNNNSRVQGVSENESKRVKTVRQWIESNSNTREAESSGSIRRLYGRQAYLDLLTRFQIERKQEIQSLLENRPVSTFTHRNRIQSLLRGRFLWNQRFIQEEKSISNAANELGLLRQTQTVSDIRKGILSRLRNRDGPQYDTSSENSMDDIVNETDTVNTINDVSQSHTVDSEEQIDPEEEINGQIPEHEENRELALIEFTETRNQEPIVEDEGNEWRNLTDFESNEGLQDSNSIENEEEWYDNVLEETNTITNNREIWYREASDDDNNNRPELRELMNRRRVSNLLESDFRLRLDRLIQLRLDQQDQGSEPDDDEDEWNRESEDEDNNENATVVVESEIGIGITQQSDCHVIDGLRVDMANLQERMNNMQKTLETCMNMQLELQKSVKEEVSSALNRESESGCFLCCGGGFDSTRDRSGHVYVCSKCAVKIDWSKVKESVKHP